MALQVLSETTTVETFEPRLSRDQLLDWEALGLPSLGAAFEVRQGAWREQFAEGQFVVPRFHRRKTRRKARPHLKLDHSPESSGFWCGGVTVPPAADQMAWVEGQWSAPLVSLPDNPIGGQTYILSSWIGIDGDYGSNDVLQAGCDANIVLNDGTMQYSYQPWWQWYPGRSWTIDGVAIAPGDVISCKIVSAPGSYGSATIVFSNLTNGQHASFGVSAPTADTLLSGRCAEWIVEAFGTLGPMASFTGVEFDNCYSGTAGGQTIASGQGATIQMVDASGEVLANANFNGPASVAIT